VSQNDIFLLALGIVSSLSMVMSAIAIKRGRLLTFSLIANLLCVAQYAFIGSYVGMLMCSVGVIRSLIFLLGEKHAVFNHWLFLFGFISTSVFGFFALNNWSDVSWHSFLPLVGSILSSIAVFFTDVRYTKVTLIATGSVWLTYEFYSGLYTQMIGEGFTVLGNIVALSVLAAGYRKGVPVDQIRSVEEQFGDAVTGAIPVITGKIPVITGKISQVTTKTRPIPVQY